MKNEWQSITTERVKELTSVNYPIFDFFASAHNLLLTESEIKDIINLVKGVLNENTI